MEKVQWQWDNLHPDIRDAADGDVSRMRDICRDPTWHVWLGAACFLAADNPRRALELYLEFHCILRTAVWITVLGCMDRAPSQAWGGSVLERWANSFEWFCDHTTALLPDLGYACLTLLLPNEEEIETTVQVSEALFCTYLRYGGLPSSELTDAIMYHRPEAFKVYCFAGAEYGWLDEEVGRAAAEYDAHWHVVPGPPESVADMYALETPSKGLVTEPTEYLELGAASYTQVYEAAAQLLRHKRAKPKMETFLLGLYRNNRGRHVCGELWEWVYKEFFV